MNKIHRFSIKIIKYHNNLCKYSGRIYYYCIVILENSQQLWPFTNNKIF